MTVQTLKMARGFMSDILEGHKQITIRYGKRNITEGLLVAECAEGLSENIDVTVNKVIVCKLCEVTLEDLQKDGFADHADMLHGMKHFYPDINFESDVTVIHFTRNS